MYQKPYNSSIGNPYLQINCAMDMDSMEITKTKAIKKYEENSYLLGRIFELREEVPESKNTENNIISTTVNKIKKKENDDIDTTELFEERIDDGYYDIEEKVDSALREFSKKFENNKWEDKKILDKLIEMSNIYKKEEDFQEKEKLEFEKSSKKFENILNLFKNMKTGEIKKNEVIDLVKQCKEEGFIDEKTLNNFNEFIEKYNKIENDEEINDFDIEINDKNKDSGNKMEIEDVIISPDEKEIPFTHKDKIITIPL